MIGVLSLVIFSPSSISSSCVSLTSYTKYFTPSCIYLTNVVDPYHWPLAQVVQVYARRWDIELAFRVLKDHLPGNQMWSAKWNIIGVQIWACLILAQCFHALQVELAHEAGVPVFDARAICWCNTCSRRCTRDTCPLARCCPMHAALA